MQPLPNPSNAKENIKKCWIDPRRPISSLKLNDKKTEENLMIDYSLEIGDKYSVQMPIYPLSKTYTKINGDLTMLKSEIIAKVIMGDLSVEEGMAQYRAQSEALNVSIVESEMNTIK